MRRNSKRKIILAAGIALIAILLFWLVLRFVVNSSLLDEQFGDTGGWGNDIEETLITIGDTDYISLDDIDTYLLIGTDAGGEDLGEAYSGELADVLVLLIVDNTTKKFAFYTIDRNTMTPVNVLNEDGSFNSAMDQQICLAHWYGLDDEQRNFNTVDAVSNLLGVLEIDNYYTLSMNDIGHLNNAIGGVEVRIDTDMTKIDPAFENGKTVKLTDEQAEKYLRARYALEDATNASRMGRQQQYMQNAYTQVTGQAKENPEYINDLYDKLKGYLKTDGSSKEVSVAVNHMMQYENMGFIKFSGETKINDTQGDGVEHEEFYVDDDSILEGLQKVINLREDDQ